MNSLVPDPPRVLLIDDAAPTRERLCAWMAEEGFTVVGCAAEREEILRRFAQVRPDCVVFDVPLHDPCGFALLVELRRRCAGCLLIVLTNELTDEVRRRCADAAVQHVLDKSTEFDRVGAMLTRWRARA